MNFWQGLFNAQNAQANNGSAAGYTEQGGDHVGPNDYQQPQHDQMNPMQVQMAIRALQGLTGPGQQQQQQVGGFHNTDQARAGGQWQGR